METGDSRTAEMAHRVPWSGHAAGLCAVPGGAVTENLIQGLSCDPSLWLARLLDHLIGLGKTAQLLRRALDGGGDHPEDTSQLIGNWREHSGTSFPRWVSTSRELTAIGRSIRGRSRLGNSWAAIMAAMRTRGANVSREPG